MSFAGQALNMIKSTQMNRAQLRRNRERIREYRTIIDNQKFSSIHPNLTLEEFDRINNEIKLYEAERERKSTRLRLVIYGVVLALAIITFIIFSVW